MTKDSIQTETESNPKSQDGGALKHLWLSPWTSWVGLRYLKSKKNSRFLSFITLLSILGVGLGVTALIVVLSVMNGFENELKKRMMSSDLHILIQPTAETPSFNSGFVQDDVVSAAEIDQLMKLGGHQIEHLWPVISTEAILKSGRKVAGIVLKGATPERIERIKSQLIESMDPELLKDRENKEEEVKSSTAPSGRLPGIFIGQELAYEMGMIAGDEVTLISPTETEGPLSGVPRLKRYVIEGIYHSGLPEQELHTAFAKDSSVRSFLRRSHALSQWEIAVKDFDQAPELARKIQKILPSFQVRDWMQLNASLFASLRLERFAMFVILAFIVVVASFNIVTTLTLMVLEKKKEISILKAMGARNGQVAAIFLSEGLLIGAIGISGGAFLGLVICILLKRYEFISLPDIYYDRTLPVTFDIRYYVIVSICALLIVLLACLYPSKRAARLNPLDGIRLG